MKVNTKQRKKATREFERVFGRQELVDRIYQIISKGKLVKILQGILNTEEDLYFLLALAKHDLERLVSLVRERVAG